MLIQVIISLFITLILSNCSNGWSVGSFKLNPEDTTFMAIVDQDSTIHHYENPASINKDSWCLDHKQWELITRK